MADVLTNRMRQVLQYLRDNKSQTFTSAEIAETLGVARKNAASYLSQLFKYGVIRRYPYNGKSFRYQFDKDAPDRYFDAVRVNAAELDKNSHPSPNLQKLSGKHIEQMLIAWSESPWSPKIFNSARNLPLALARLYELACEASYGAVIDQSAIDEARLNLNNFVGDLEQTLLVTKSVLATKELWRAKTIVEFLETAARAEHLQHVALKVKEAN